MSVDTRNPTTSPYAPGRLTLRMASFLLGHEGVLRESVAAEHARAVRSASSGRMPREMVTDALRPLVDAGVVVNVAGTWYATNLADLAAWIADGLEAREDRGMAFDPAIPAQRRAA